MMKSVEGVYSNGRVELVEIPPNIAEARVIVTFLSNAPARSLTTFGIDETQAADLRGRLRTFEEDWNREDMEGYDAL